MSLMDTYKIHRHDDGYIVSCNCCDSEVPTKVFSKKYLCIFCSNSWSGEGQAILAQMMNILLNELKPYKEN